MGSKTVDSLSLKLEVTDSGAVRVLRETGKEIESVGDKAKKAQGGFSKLQAGVVTLNQGLQLVRQVVGPAISAISAMVKESANLETTFARAASEIRGDATPAIAAIRHEVLELMKSVPKSADDLGAGALKVVARGYEDAGDAAKVLGASARLATAGFKTVEQSADVVSVTLTRFNRDAGDAESIANALFVAARDGAVEIEQLGEQLGASSFIAQRLGVDFEDLTAGVAALTQQGLSGSDALSGVQRILVGLNKPTKEMAALIKATGFESAAALVEARGFAGAIVAITEAAGSNTSVLSKAVRGPQALAAVLATANDQGRLWTETAKTMREGTEALDEGFQKMASTVESQSQLLENAKRRVQELAFEALAPGIVEVMRSLADGLNDATTNTSTFTAAVIDTLIPVLQEVIKLAATVGPALRFALTPNESSIPFGDFVRGLTQFRTEAAAAVEATSPVIDRLTAIGEAAKASADTNQILADSFAAAGADSELTAEEMQSIADAYEYARMNGVGLSAANAENAVKFGLVAGEAKRTAPAIRDLAGGIADLTNKTDKLSDAIDKASKPAAFALEGAKAQADATKAVVESLQKRINTTDALASKEATVRDAIAASVAADMRLVDAERAVLAAKLAVLDTASKRTAAEEAQAVAIHEQIAAIDTLKGTLDTAEERYAKFAETVKDESAKAAKEIETIGEAIGSTFSNIIAKTFEGITQGTRKLKDIVTGVRDAIVAEMAATFSEVIEEKAKKLDTPMTENLGGLEDVFGAFGTRVTEKMSGLFQAISKMFGGLFGGGGFLSGLASLFGGVAVAGGGAAGFASLFSGFTGLDVNSGAAIGATVAPMLADALAGPTIANALAGGVFSALSGPLGAEAAASFASVFGNAAIPVLGAVLGSVLTGADLATTLGSAVGAGIGSFFGPIGTVIGSMLGSVVGGLFSKQPSARDLTREQVDKFLTAVTGEQFRRKADRGTFTEDTAFRDLDDRAQDLVGVLGVLIAGTDKLKFATGNLGLIFEVAAAQLGDTFGRAPEKLEGAAEKILGSLELDLPTAIDLFVDTIDGVAERLDRAAEIEGVGGGTIDQLNALVSRGLLPSIEDGLTAIIEVFKKDLPASLKDVPERVVREAEAAALRAIPSPFAGLVPGADPTDVLARIREEAGRKEFGRGDENSAIRGAFENLLKAFERGDVRFRKGTTGRGVDGTLATADTSGLLRVLREVAAISDQTGDLTASAIANLREIFGDFFAGNKSNFTGGNKIQDLALTSLESAFRELTTGDLSLPPDIADEFAVRLDELVDDFLNGTIESAADVLAELNREFNLNLSVDDLGITGEDIVRRLQIQEEAFAALADGLAEGAKAFAASGDTEAAIQAFTRRLGELTQQRASEAINKAFLQVTDIENLAGGLFTNLEVGTQGIIDQFNAGDITGEEAASAIDALVQTLGADFEELGRKAEQMGPLIERFAELQESIALALTTFSQAAEHAGDITEGIDLLVADLSGEGQSARLEAARKAAVDAQERILSEAAEALGPAFALLFNIVGQRAASEVDFDLGDVGGIDALRANIKDLSDEDLKRLVGQFEELAAATYQRAQAEIAALQEQLALVEQWVSVADSARDALDRIDLAGLDAFDRGPKEFAQAQKRFAESLNDFRSGTDAERLAAAQELTQLGPALLELAQQAGFGPGSPEFELLRGSVVNALRDVEKEAAAKEAERDSIQEQIRDAQDRAAEQLKLLREFTTGVQEELLRRAAEAQEATADALGPVGDLKPMRDAMEGVFDRLNEGINVFNVGQKRGRDEAFEPVSLAAGGIVTRSVQPALLHGPEAVIPLDRLSGIVRDAVSVDEIRQRRGGGDDIEAIMARLERALGKRSVSASIQPVIEYHEAESRGGSADGRDRRRGGTATDDMDKVRELRRLLRLALQDSALKTDVRRLLEGMA